MKKIILLILMINQAIYAQNTGKTNESFTISNIKNSAVSPRLTTDNQGNPVLSWAEEDDSSDVVAVCFAISKDGGKTFGNKKYVRITEGVTAHAEGMPKIAFKNDGTIVAVYETKRPTPESRFAGDLKYTMSTDGGDTWATPQYVHADTTAGKSRSFSDLVHLPNGEIGISWLGEAPSKAGRPVKFAQTTKGQGFSQEVTAKEGACQCCRTNLFVDNEEVIHIYFRDILEDGSRDMGHVVSTDVGKTFGNYQLVYPDKWKVNACPHTGPSTAQLGSKLYTAWYTGEEKNVGVKIIENGGKLMTHIKSANARHPQLAATKDKLVLVWDYPSDRKDKFASLIHARYVTADGKTANQIITTDTESATFPTVLVSGKNIIVAYESQIGNDKKQVKYCLVAAQSVF